jgi:hypothetical protein
MARMCEQPVRPSRAQRSSAWLSLQLIESVVVVELEGGSAAPCVDQLWRLPAIEYGGWRFAAARGAVPADEGNNWSVAMCSSTERAARGGVRLMESVCIATTSVYENPSRCRSKPLHLSFSSLSN